MIDCSFLCHAMIRSQSTPEARAALGRLLDRGDEMIGAPGLHVEFPSVRRRHVSRRGLDNPAAAAVFRVFQILPITPYPATEELTQRAWDFATRLGQSDIFDAMGYAVAEAIDGEFWTSDRRFANAVANIGLSRVRVIA